MGGKTVEAQFNRPVSDVYEACRRSVAELGYTVLNSDREDGQISFNTGRSMSSWHGQDLTVTLFQDGDKTRAVLSGSLAKGGSALTGGGSQIFSWGEKKKLSEKFLKAVEKILPNVESAVSKATPSATDNGSIADELTKLAKLRDDGALTESEFADAKQRLIK